MRLEPFALHTKDVPGGDMTEQVEELTRGEALARVAVLEAELAELRKRVCVPEGCVVVVGRGGSGG